MTTSVDGLDASTRKALQNDLLCIADTKLVLGNWFAECVTNGKSLPDFAAMLGMCTASYGQTRAMYRQLDTLDHSYHHLELERGADEIRSANLLDVPPSGLPDFIVTTWLAELATWSLVSGFLQHPDRTIAGNARKVGEESYFHLKYAAGWLRIMASSESEREQVRQSMERRYPLGLQWFGPADHEDALHASGHRDDSIANIRAGFIREVDSAMAAFDVPLDVSPGFDAAWRPDARRVGALPATLWEVVRFKDAAMAR